MSTPLQVLIADDRQSDAELMAQELRRAGYEVDWQRVDTEREFRLRLTPRLQLILTDHRMPSFDAPTAIRILKESKLNVPIIVVSGSIGDDKAVEFVKQGATDYILKDRLARLGMAAGRALDECRLREERRRLEEQLRQSDEQMRGILSTVEDVVWSLSLTDWKVRYINPAGEKMFGRSVDEFFQNGQLWVESVHPEDRQRVLEAQQSMIRWGTGDVSFRILRPDGSIRHVHTRAWCAYGSDGKPLRLEGISTDVSEKMLHEAQLAREHAALEEAQQIAHLGSWEWDLATDRATLSKEGWRIWDMELGSASYTRDLMPRVHPDDRARFERVVKEAVQSQRDYDVTVRISAGRGGRWTRHRGRIAHRGLDGKTLALSGTVEDITEEKLAEQQREQLEHSRMEARRLAELNDFKTQFINMVSHDLNNVVMPLKLRLYTVSQAVGASRVPDVETIEAMSRGIARLEGFLADLLDAARLQSGKLRLSLTEFDLSSQLREVVDAARPESQEHEIRLEADLHPDVRVKADARRVEQVVTNLLSNALKFTPKGGRVQVMLKTQGSAAELSVVDSGVGIRPEDQAKLFQPFTQVSQAVQGKHSGTGLGLFICKGIVVEHGGTIECESEGPGKGSTFRVRLPVNPPKK